MSHRVLPSNLVADFSIGQEKEGLQQEEGHMLYTGKHEACRYNSVLKYEQRPFDNIHDLVCGLSVFDKLFHDLHIRVNVSEVIFISPAKITQSGFAIFRCCKPMSRTFTVAGESNVTTKTFPGKGCGLVSSEPGLEFG